MNAEIINRAIYEKYITPTKNKTRRLIGIEIELPVVNLEKKPVEEKVIFELSDAFCRRFGFFVCGRDMYGNPNSMQDNETGDNLSFDCCYSNLELSLGKVENLHSVKRRFDEYYSFINGFLGKYNYTLTGMGINPYYNINHNRPIENERYRMLYHHLHSYKKYEGGEIAFHSFPSFGTFTSASQVQIDVFYEDLIKVINTFGRLEPFKSLLFSNSVLPDEPELLCARNMLWERSMQGYNPHNIGMYEYELKDVDDLVEYIKSTSIYCVMRDGRYVNFTPIPVADYFNADRIRGEYFDGESYRETEFEPRIEDLEYLRSFKFEDLTFRGTIEFRSQCTQPIYDSMCIAALHIGLLENLEALRELLYSDNVIYAHGYSATELQRLFSKRTLPSFLDREKLIQELVSILDIAAGGLEKRGMDEGVFLKPLYERAKTLSNPASEMLKGIEGGKTLEYYIEKYSKAG